MSSALRLQRPLKDDGISAVRQLGQAVRIAESLLFAAREPLSEDEIASPFPMASDQDVMAHLQGDLRCARGQPDPDRSKWAFRTADDLGYLLSKEIEDLGNFPRAAVETLSIIAYHQPVTRAEIEEIRGVATAKGTLDVFWRQAGSACVAAARRRADRLPSGRPRRSLAFQPVSDCGSLPGWRS